MFTWNRGLPFIFFTYIANGMDNSSSQESVIMEWSKEADTEAPFTISQAMEHVKSDMDNDNLGKYAELMYTVIEKDRTQSPTTIRSCKQLYRQIQYRVKKYKEYLDHPETFDINTMAAISDSRRELKNKHRRETQLLGTAYYGMNKEKIDASPIIKAKLGQVIIGEFFGASWKIQEKYKKNIEKYTTEFTHKYRGATEAFKEQNYLNAFRGMFEAEELALAVLWYLTQKKEEDQTLEIMSAFMNNEAADIPFITSMANAQIDPENRVIKTLSREELLQRCEKKLLHRRQTLIARLTDSENTSDDNTSETGNDSKQEEYEFKR